MLIKDEHHSSVLTLPRSQDRCAADGAPDNRRLGSAGCWNDPDKTSKRRVQKKSSVKPPASPASQFGLRP
jgi:hypothetical protein